MSKSENVIIATIVAVVTIVGTCFAVSNQFVSRSEFNLLSSERGVRMDGFDKHFERIELKLDKLLESRGINPASISIKSSNNGNDN